MKVVFFLEPRIESSASFRYPTLRNSILPQIKALNEANVDTHVILGDSIENLALSDGFINYIGSYTVIDSKELAESVSMSYDEVAYNLQSYKNKKLHTNLTRFYARKLTNIFPDIIISWESNIDYLSDVFPNSSIIYQWPGILSRIPYPEMINFDIGLLDRSYFKYLDRYSELQEQDIEKLQQYFSKYEEHFDHFSLIKNNLINWKSKYKKVILLPLQVDNYFTVTTPLNRRKNQLELVEDILHNIPPDIGVIITEYRSKSVNCNVLSDDNIFYLKNKYQNFIDTSSILHIPFISQYLVHKVDGVITISSSVGLQAAIWKKPLLTIGKSHITSYASAENYDCFIEQVFFNTPNNQYNRLFIALSKMNICLNDIKNEPKKFKNWLFNLNEFIQKRRVDWPNYYENSDELIKNLKFNERITNFIHSNANIFLIRDYKQTGNCSELSDQIKKKKIISFDIFDTLLVRPFQKPKDLFDFISNDVKNIINNPTFDFSYYRVKSESIAFENSIKEGFDETTLNDIYKEFKKITGVNQKEVNKIRLLEINTEKNLLYKREVGYKAYIEAYTSGKKIILISDMYLPKNILDEILKKNGYLYHDQLFVSCETKVKKSSGKMYTFVMNSLNIQSNDLLHIGDNLKADIIVPKKLGIKTFHLPKTIECFKQSSAYLSVWKRDEQRHSLDWKILQAIQANRLFDNPYSIYRKNTLFNGDLLNLGYYGVGSMLLGFTKWIIENAILNKEKHLYFLSRDGKILFDIYEKIKVFYPKAPSASYLLCSRRAVNLAKIESINDIKDLVFVDYANNVTLGFILENRFGIKFEEVDNSIFNKLGIEWNIKLPADDKSILLDVALELKELIFKKAKRERNNYIEYLKSQNLFNFSETDNIAIIDIGYAGTMQESLYKISNYRFSGYYFITFRKALERVIKNNMNIYGYQANFIDRHDTYHPFCRYVPLFETFFSNQDTSLVRFEKNSNNKLIPIFMRHNQNEAQRMMVTARIHMGVNLFVDDIITALGNHLVDIDIEPNKTLRVLNQYFTDPHPRDAKLLSNIQFEDAYGGGGYKLLVPYENNIDLSCIWINGKNAILRDINISNKNVNTPNNKHFTSSNKTQQLTTNLEKKIKYKLANLVLNERKYKKLLNSPELFVSDIKNRFIKKIMFSLFTDINYKT